MKDTTALPVELQSPALQNHFVSAEQLQPPAGVPTGISLIDNFLLWRGVPRGELSLFQGAPGTGATSLWIHLTQQVHQQGKWVAWVNAGAQLFPTHLLHRQIDLKKLLVVKKTSEPSKLFWILQEMISSCLFEVIGCQLQELSFKNHQLEKLKRLCRRYKVALVFVSHKPTKFINPLFSLMIHFQRDFVCIQRALHRPTPFNVAGSMIHANFMPQFKNVARKLLA